MSNTAIVREGFLQKQSPSIFKGWQDRYFMLKGSTLFYYASKDSYGHQDKPKGVVHLEQDCLQRPNDKAKRRYFNIVSGRRTYHLRAATDEEAQQWEAAIARETNTELPSNSATAATTTATSPPSTTAGPTMIPPPFRKAGSGLSILPATVSPPPHASSSSGPPAHAGLGLGFVMAHSPPLSPTSRSCDQRPLPKDLLDARKIS